MAGFSRFLKRWANTGAVLEPSDAQANAGFAFLGATPPSVELFNAIQQDNDDKDNTLYNWIAAVLTAAGIVPADASPGQLLEALNDMFADETAARIAGDLANAPGRLIGVQVFATPGTATYTPTPGTGSVVVEVQGAGAAGGGLVTNVFGNCSAGTPGASGAYGKSRITSGFSGVTVTVGSKGTAVSGGMGGNGQASSFGTFVSAPGGIGGSAGFSQVGSASGGNGNFTRAVGANLFAADGMAGTPSFGQSTGQIGFGGAGGISVFGPGGIGSQSNLSPGGSSLSPGSGGGGTFGNGNTITVAGANGADGIVIVWEYSS